MGSIKISNSGKESHWIDGVGKFGTTSQAVRHPPKSEPGQLPLPGFSDADIAHLEPLEAKLARWERERRQRAQ